MPRVGFEPTIQVFERTKTVHALDRAARLTYLLDEGELTVSRSGCFTPGNEPPVPIDLEGYVGLRAGLHAVAAQ
jgi:hypothetical protein